MPARAAVVLKGGGAEEGGGGRGSGLAEGLCFWGWHMVPATTQTCLLHAPQHHLDPHS